MLASIPFVSQEMDRIVMWKAAKVQAILPQLKGSVTVDLVADPANEIDA
jgi:hypothetical protein